MGISIISGLADKAAYCPYCGERIGEHRGDGMNICDGCGKAFGAIEDECSGIEPGNY